MNQLDGCESFRLAVVSGLRSGSIEIAPSVLPNSIPVSLAAQTPPFNASAQSERTLAQPATAIQTAGCRLQLVFFDSQLCQSHRQAHSVNEKYADNSPVTCSARMPTDAQAWLRLACAVGFYWSRMVPLKAPQTLDSSQRPPMAVSWVGSARRRVACIRRKWSAEPLGGPSEQSQLLSQCSWSSSVCATCWLAC